MTSPEFVVPDGMPRSVWENKYARRTADGTFQSWSERITEVVQGNFLLDPRITKWKGARFTSPEAMFEHITRLNQHISFEEMTEFEPVLAEYEATRRLACQGVLPFSGRHLQHGDLRQPEKMGELFTNCSTACFSFVKFFQLLKGSGVGRLYDDDLCWVNWDFTPNCRFVLTGPDMHGVGGHPDYEPWIEDARAARAKYDGESEHVRWFEVEDSAEGWVKVVAVLETAAFHQKNKDKLFVFDFSAVRPKGSPIMGQQGRPASGPVPFIQALHNVLTVKGAGWKPWKQALYIDHYLSECVLVGGIRRSARIAVKSWRDPDVIEFIDAKRGGFLHTANNSIAVDAEFWSLAQSPKPTKARRVLDAAVGAAYYDGTGEPGFINVDKLTADDAGMDAFLAQPVLNPDVTRSFAGHPRTAEMVAYITKKAVAKRYKYLTNPCGEVILSAWGGYCVIADICLANATSCEDALEAGRMAARFLIRTNRMRFLYAAEVARTNRIGVSLTGIHEFAAKVFGCTFTDLVAVQQTVAAINFWRFVDDLRQVTEASAREFAQECGMAVPHTVTTIKPSGTVSKVMACTEGAHLPALPHYMRWIMHPKWDGAHPTEPSREVAALAARGYPVKDVSHQYRDHVVVGFPTKLPIADLLGDAVVTAHDVTPAQQYEWLRRLEATWLGTGNNQISYTLKYRPAEVSETDFRAMLLTHQSTVRCCAVMPQEDLDTTAYAYLPEEPLSRATYEAVASSIDRDAREAYDAARLECESGACPIEPDRPMMVGVDLANGTGSSAVVTFNPQTNLILRIDTAEQVKLGMALPS